jgi:hypothetical protein
MAQAQSDRAAAQALELDKLSLQIGQPAWAERALALFTQDASLADALRFNLGQSTNLLKKLSMLGAQADREPLQTALTQVQSGIEQINLALASQAEVRYANALQLADALLETNPATQQAAVTRWLQADTANVYAAQVQADSLDRALTQRQQAQATINNPAANADAKAAAQDSLAQALASLD